MNLTIMIILHSSQPIIFNEAQIKWSLRCYSRITKLYVLLLNAERNVFDKFTSKEIRMQSAVQYECITSETAGYKHH
jgi:hypothetical protein